jgi:hypothetical protein
MAGAMEKIKAKVENVLHKDKSDTTHTDTTGTHTTGTHTAGTHSKLLLHFNHSSNTDFSRRPHWSSRLSRCQPG